LESSDFEINFEEDNYDAGARDAVLDVTERAYIAGAEWRVNSVWHKTKDEVPQAHGEYENEHYPQIPCLVYGKLSTGTGYGVRYWNVTEQCWDDEECDDYECSKDAIEEWAYLDDLIPNKKQ
jgi:hypothetical protein